MRRFYSPDLTEDAKTLEITGDELNHLARVLRLGPGSRVAVINGRGVEAEGVIEEVTRDSAVVAVESVRAGAGESPLELTLIQALVKSSKPELIVQKATELGANRVVFYPSARSVTRPGSKGAERKAERWVRVAVEAAKQCERSVVPEVALAEDLAGAVEAAGEVELRLILTERGGGPLSETLKGPEGPVSSVVLLVGPEGGFTPEELDGAASFGFSGASLGPRILRSETAAVAALAVVQHLLGDGRGGKAEKL